MALTVVLRAAGCAESLYYWCHRYPCNWDILSENRLGIVVIGRITNRSIFSNLLVLGGTNVLEMYKTTNAVSSTRYAPVEYEERLLVPVSRRSTASNPITWSLVVSYYPSNCAIGILGIHNTDGNGTCNGLLREYLQTWDCVFISRAARSFPNHSRDIDGLIRSLISMQNWKDHEGFMRRNLHVRTTAYTNKSSLFAGGTMNDGHVDKQISTKVLYST